MSKQAFNINGLLVDLGGLLVDLKAVVCCAGNCFFSARIKRRNNHKLLARVKAFDRHCNLVLENVKEMWTETPKTGKGTKH